MTPRRQIRHLSKPVRSSGIDLQGAPSLTNDEELADVDKDKDEERFARWEYFRDGLIQRWTNLNIVVSVSFGLMTTSLLIFSMFVSPWSEKCGLIMRLVHLQEGSSTAAFMSHSNPSHGSAVSTILCSNVPLSDDAFAFGIVSLLSSLISIGFGVGLIYVLGDVRGRTLNVSPRVLNVP